LYLFDINDSLERVFLVFTFPFLESGTSFNPLDDSYKAPSNVQNPRKLSKSLLSLSLLQIIMDGMVIPGGLPSQKKPGQTLLNPSINIAIATEDPSCAKDC
jgi:hypothetical protein